MAQRGLDVTMARQGMLWVETASYNKWRKWK